MEVNANNEKISINMNVTDLGYIDLLIEQGFFSNRTDFIKTAVRNELDKRNDVLDRAIEHESSSYAVSIGIRKISKKDIEIRMENNLVEKMLVIGMLVISEEVNLLDLQNVFPEIRVHGVIKASKSIKKHYSE